ncbi:MAG TPA: response regulator [Thermoanaerobaculia bacterium]|nr:response regulator [Thermoanaerobaculia bacterium]
MDDDPAIRTLLFTILRRRGLAVDMARHGGEALERLARCNYVLLVLDLMMPVMNGWDVMERVSAMQRPDRPALILMTAGSELRDFDPDIVIGSIRKPFDVELVYDMIVGCISAVAPRTQPAGCSTAESET